MLGIDLQSVTISTLEQLCQDRASESQTLEFKRELPAKSDDGRLEFCKDVCAFANSDGGDIVFGVAEASGSANTINLIKTESPDRAIRRLIETLESGVEPRIHGLKWQPIDGPDGYVLVLRIPAAFDGPYRQSKGERRFVMRDHARTSDLTYQQLRNAFSRSGRLIEQASAFIERRLAAIRLDQRAGYSDCSPSCVVHLVPISSMDGRHQLDIHKMLDDVNFPKNFVSWEAVRRRLNLDGVRYAAAYDEGRPGHYAQVFRTGVFEVVVQTTRQNGPVYLIHAGGITKYFRDMALAVVSTAARFGVSGPAALALSILNLGPYKLSMAGGAYPSDRKELLLPDIWLDSIGEDRDLESMLQNVLDVLWQSFGLSYCEMYRNGKWSEHGWL